MHDLCPVRALRAALEGRGDEHPMSILSTGRRHAIKAFTMRGPYIAGAVRAMHGGAGTTR